MTLCWSRDETHICFFFVFIIVARSYMESFPIADVVHSFIETVQVSELIKIKHISPSTSVFIVAPPTNSEELQWDHHDQFLLKEKKKKKLQQSKRLSYHFCRFLFRLFMACYTFHSAVRCACVGGCCPWRHFGLKQKTGLQNKLAFRQPPTTIAQII